VSYSFPDVFAVELNNFVWFHHRLDVPYERANVHGTRPEEELLKLRTHDNAKLSICDRPDVLYCNDKGADIK
jgi:hypothetical protein